MQRFKKVFLISFTLLLAFTILSCKPAEKKMTEPTIGKTLFPLTVKDEAGRKVTIKKRPERIISIAPSNTEILFALGLAKNVVGVDDFSDYPKAAQNKEKIGGFSKPNIEKIIALKPDLVLTTGGVQKAAVQELEKLGITAFVLDSNKVRDVIEAIRKVGKITGRSEAAQKLAQEMEDEIEKITSKTDKLKEEERLKVFYELYREPLMSAGPGTFVDDMITLAGGKNIAAQGQEEYPQFSLEILLQEDPPVYLAASGSMSDAGDIKKRPGWENLNAVKEEKVYVIEENLVNRPGPRIVEGLKEIARAIHPELFP